MMSNQQGSFKQFIQLPGPNPILIRGDKGAWDESCIECCDVFKEHETYYLYYHGVPLDKDLWPHRGYRIGVATASHPLGPWTKYSKNPIIGLGPKGSWEDEHVACATILKEKDKYYMWYSARSEKDPTMPYSKWSIGLATASHPLGPWKKCEDNPFLEDFGYVAGVVKVNGEYYMYSEYPIAGSDQFSCDYGPISLAVSNSPEGPWTKSEDNPVLSPDDWGSWDSGGFSEAKVTYRDGVFHIFYGAAKSHPKQRILTSENIGYAYSFDGHNFTKYIGNPVAMREKNPDASAFAEVHSLFEPPLVYLYHTLRYISSLRPGIEDIGVQVLATSTPFQLTMPILNINSLPPETTSSLGVCPPISLEHIHNLALTSECTYNVQTTEGLRVHIRSSHNGIDYDTCDLYTFDNHFEPGKTTRKTVELTPKVRFIKVLVENLSNTQDIIDIKITTTLGY